jgi:UDP-N-acetylmuramate--alanine ligase
MKIHFIGIGGIGLSALARFLRHQGHEVKGSDIAHTPLTRKLIAEGIPVMVPQGPQNITGDEDLVIYSAAIKPQNPELVAARKKGVPTLSRKEALPTILGDKKVFAVAGAHGKSTTSAILAAILQDASAIIGAESKEFGSNVRCADGELVVFEADESDASFLECNPHCAIVTNAEPEHMDFYKSLDRFYDAYERFLRLAKKRVLNDADPFLHSVDLAAVRLDPAKDLRVFGYLLRDGEPYVRFGLGELGEFEVWGFGEHIALDAALAILAALEVTDLEQVRKNIGRYRGIKKRFDILQKHSDFVLIDDYGHHPTEIEATMESVREYAALAGLDEITVIWQPHKYSRVLDNLERFAECFGKGVRLVILPVWAAGEESVEIDFAGTFARYEPMFADRVRGRDGCVELLRNGEVMERIDRGLVVGFGAGDITYQLRGIG